MSATTTTTQINQKPSKPSMVKHLSPKASTSSLPAPTGHNQKHIAHQDSLSSAKSGPIIANVVPSSNLLSTQASLSRDDPRALLTALLSNIECGDDRTRTGVSRSDTVSSSAPSLAIDARLLTSRKMIVYLLKQIPLNYIMYRTIRYFSSSLRRAPTVLRLETYK